MIVFSLEPIKKKSINIVIFSHFMPCMTWCAVIDLTWEDTTQSKETNTVTNITKTREKPSCSKAGVNLAAQARAKGELRKKWVSQTSRSNILRTWPVLLRVHQEALTPNISQQRAKGGTGGWRWAWHRAGGEELRLQKKAMFQRAVRGEGTMRGACR